jgi:hypothetical protein
LLQCAGLNGSSSYTVLGTIEVFVEGYGKSRLAEKGDDRQDKKYKKLIKLRNIFSKDDWRGDWSSTSHL